MKWVFNDGGRSRAGYKGRAGDCVARSISIVTEMDYQDVYDLINQYAKKERKGKRKRGKSSAREGVYKPTIRKIMADLGWKWTPTMLIGQGCKVHLKEEELPKGRLLVSVSKHITAVIDGVVNDTHDPCREETRCVYGYWEKSKGAKR